MRFCFQLLVLVTALFVLDAEARSDIDLQIPVSLALEVRDDGLVRDFVTGEVLNDQQIQAKIAPGIVVGVLIGAGSGAVGAAMEGANATGIALAAAAGGIAGVHGFIANITSGVVRVVQAGYAIGWGATPTLIGKALADKKKDEQESTPQ